MLSRRPIQTVVMGSNTFIACHSLLSLHNAYLLRLSWGHDQPPNMVTPLASLCVPTPPASALIHVEDNVVGTSTVGFLPGVEINPGRVAIVLQGQTLLEVRTLGHDRVEVSHLDLRPLGLAITADSGALWLGGSCFMGNTFGAGGTGINFGETTKAAVHL